MVMRDRATCDDVMMAVVACGKIPFCFLSRGFFRLIRMPYVRTHRLAATRDARS